MGQGIITREEISVDDITKNVRDSYQKLIDKIDKTNTALNKNIEIINAVATSANTKTKKGLDELTIAYQKVQQAVDTSNKNDKEKIVIAKQLEQITAKSVVVDRELAKEKMRVRLATQQLNKELKDELILENKHVGTLEKVMAKNRQLIREREGLNTATKEGKTRLDQINAALDINNRYIESNSDKMKRQRLGIGRYENALRSVRGTLMRVAGALGLVGGAFAIFSKVKNTIVDFDQSMATLGAITGENTEKLRGLARQLGGDTVFTASEAADAMTKLAMAGYDTNQILQATTGTLALAAAGQIDLAQSADIASNVVSGFGLAASETDRVVDVLAKTATSTNTTVSTLGESFKEIAPTANNLKIPIEEVAAAVGLLGNSGIKGTDATTTLNSALNRLSKPTKEMKMKMKELNLEFFDSNGQFIGITKTIGHLNERMRGLTDEQRANAISTIFGARANKQMTSLLLGQTKATVDGKEQTLKGAEALEYLTEEYENAEGAAKKMAEEQIDSVGGSFKLLNSAIEEYIIGTDEANGISDKLKATFKFLAENIKTVFHVMGLLVKSFIVFKTTMFAMKMRDRYMEWREFGKSVKGAGGAVKEATSNVKKFGQAIKGIGFAAAIAAAWELFKAWANIAFKVGQYEQFLKRQEAARARGGENAQKRVEEREKAFQDEINAIRLTMSERKKAGENAEDLAKEEERRIKELTESRNIAVNKDIDTVKKRKLAALDELEAVRKAREKYLDRLGGEDIARGLAATQKLQGGGLILDTITEFDRQFTNAQAAVTGATAKLEIYRGESDSLTQSIIDQTITINENTGATGDSTKAIKEKTQSYKDLTDAINAAGEAENERLQLIEDFNISESEKNTQSAIDAANKIATETGVIEDGRIENALKREEELKRAQIERIFLVRVEESENAEQVELAMEQRNQALFLLDEELYNKKKDAINNLNELQESYAESLKNEVTAVEDNNEEIFNAFKNLQEALTDVLSEQIDARMNLLDKEKDAAKSRQDYYEALAANGNITAEKSIKKQIELQREAEQEQARLAKIKQNVEMISAGLKTFTAAIEGGDTPAQALATTLTTTQVLASILGNINFFEKGTDNAPEGWAVVDEKGAEIHTDSKGNIKDLGSDKGARWKYLDAGDKIVTANKSAALINKFDQIGMSSIVNESKDHAGNSYDLMKLDQTLKGMTSKMDKLQTKIEVDWQGLAGGMARVNVHTTKGGDKRTERYTIR